MVVIPSTKIFIKNNSENTVYEKETSDGKYKEPEEKFFEIPPWTLTEYLEKIPTTKCKGKVSERPENNGRTITKLVKNSGNNKES